MDILLADALGEPVRTWLLFLGLVLCLLAFGLGGLHRKAHGTDVRDSLHLCAFRVPLRRALGGGRLRAGLETAAVAPALPPMMAAGADRLR